MIPQVFTFLRLKARFLKLDHKEGVSVSDNDVTYYIFSAESHLCYVGCSLATVIQVVEVLKKDAVPPFFLQGVFFNWASPENVSRLAPPHKFLDWPPSKSSKNENR